MELYVYGVLDIILLNLLEVSTNLNIFSKYIFNVPTTERWLSFSPFTCVYIMWMSLIFISAEVFHVI